MPFKNVTTQINNINVVIQNAIACLTNALVDLNEKVIFYIELHKQPMNLHDQFKNMADLELYSINQHLKEIEDSLVELKEVLNVTREPVTEKEPIAIIHHPQIDNNKNVQLAKEHVMEFIRDYGPSIEDGLLEIIRQEALKLKLPVNRCNNDWFVSHLVYES